MKALFVFIDSCMLRVLNSTLLIYLFTCISFQGGDKFVLLLNKPLPSDVDIQSSLFCVRFGSGSVVPASLWKEQAIVGEYIPSMSV